MTSLTCTLRSKGLLNLPGITSKAKKVTEELLTKDFHLHHCYFRTAGLHNHLSHHILAAYDLGAQPGLLRKIYEDEAKIQRPIALEDRDKTISITQDNWTQYLGDANAYNGFFNFFAAQVRNNGITNTLEEYIFSSNANAKGPSMLVRLMSGVLHPFIQVGYGVEFEDELIVAAGLAQTAVHKPLPESLFDINFTKTSKVNSSNPKEGYLSRKGPSVLELIHQIYESPVLKPVMPYDSNALISVRQKDALKDGREEEIKRICSQFFVDGHRGDAEFEEKVGEFIWASTLLLFGTGKEGRKPRLDFFLMHLLTSSFFLKAYFRILNSPAHKTALLHAYLPMVPLVMMIRGRPVIKPDLLMSYTDSPRPPVPSTLYKPDKSAVGSPQNDEEYNPWPELLQSVLYAPDSHVLKTMRSLLYGAQRYGDTAPGEAFGAFRNDTEAKTETLLGTSRMDGSIFVRAAGMLMDSLGWVTHGQSAKDWDRSALGWDEAWSNED